MVDCNGWGTKHRRRHSKETKRAILAEVAQGRKCIAQIADKWNVPKQTISTWIAKNGGTTYTVPQEVWDEVDPLLGKMPDRIVARECQVSAHCVMKRRKQLGIERYKWKYEDRAYITVAEKVNEKNNEFLNAWKRSAELRAYSRWMKDFRRRQYLHKLRWQG